METSILCECKNPHIFEDDNGINYCIKCNKEAELLRKQLEIMRTQTVKLIVEEQNGLFDFDSISLSMDKEPISEYLNLRVIQSLKGFKRPMPFKVEIESVYVN